MITDCRAIAEIYAHHVLHGFGTFEETPPAVEEIEYRLRGTLEGGGVYLVAESGGIMAGYAYAGRFRPREAYRYTVEDSVYVRHGLQARGIGTSLLCALIDACSAKGFRQMIAVIGDSENSSSIGLHARAGFRQVGTATEVGFKMERWVDIVWMQRPLLEAHASE
jgi:L-amino acid N-acyltransferase YncA